MNRGVHCTARLWRLHFLDYIVMFRVLIRPPKESARVPCSSCGLIPNYNMPFLWKAVKVEARIFSSPQTNLQIDLSEIISIYFSLQVGTCREEPSLPPWLPSLSPHSPSMSTLSFSYSPLIYESFLIFLSPFYVSLFLLFLPPPISWQSSFMSISPPTPCMPISLPLTPASLSVSCSLSFSPALLNLPPLSPSQPLLRQSLPSSSVS